MDNDKQDKSLLTFPCDFTIKVFGLASNEFEKAVLAMIRKHVPQLSDDCVQTRPSENGKYMALNIEVHVDTREQLDNIYKDLSSSPLILMAL